MRGLLPPNVPGPRGPGGPPTRPAAALRGPQTTGHSRAGCARGAAGFAQVTFPCGTGPFSLISVWQLTRAREPGQHWLGAALSARPALGVSARTLELSAGPFPTVLPCGPVLPGCRLCRPPPTFVAGREGGSCRGCGFLPRLPVGSLWEVQSPRPVSIGLPTQRVFHGGAAGGSPHRQATRGDVQMSAGDLGRCATSSGNTRGLFSKGARPRLCPQVELGRE